MKKRKVRAKTAIRQAEEIHGHSGYGIQKNRAAHLLALHHSLVRGMADEFTEPTEGTAAGAWKGALRTKKAQAAMWGFLEVLAGILETRKLAEADLVPYVLVPKDGSKAIPDQARIPGYEFTMQDLLPVLERMQKRDEARWTATLSRATRLATV